MSNYTPVGPSGDQPWSSEHSGASLHDLPAPTKTEVSRDYEVTPEMFSSNPGGLLDRRRQSQARSKGAEVYSILSETVQISSRSEMADLKPDSKLPASLSDSKPPPERLLKNIANHQATADSATPGVWSDTAALPRVANDIPMFKHLLNTLGGDSSLFFSESSITDAINWKEEEQDFYWLAMAEQRDHFTIAECADRLRIIANDLKTQLEVGGKQNKRTNEQITKQTNKQVV